MFSEQLFTLVYLVYASADKLTSGAELGFVKVVWGGGDSESFCCYKCIEITKNCGVIYQLLFGVIRFQQK